MSFMSLLLKAQALQHKRMEALRKYVADIEDLDRQRHELDLASARAWMKVVHAGWATTDLTSFGLKSPKKPRPRPPSTSADDRAADDASLMSEPPDREDRTDG